MVLESQGLASLQLKAGECPLERFGRPVALRHEGVGALAQLLDGAMTGMAQDAARVDAKQQLDLVDPARMNGREVKDESLIVSGIEVVPYGLRAVGVGTSAQSALEPLVGAQPCLGASTTQATCDLLATV
jgi:hypothetical protein